MNLFRLLFLSGRLGFLEFDTNETGANRGGGHIHGHWTRDGQGGIQKGLYIQSPAPLS